MVLTTIISKSFHNCVDTVKFLGKYLAWLIASAFVMSVVGGIFNILGIITGIHITITKIWIENILSSIWWIISALIAYEVFVAFGIFYESGHGYTATSTKSEVSSKYDDLSSGANIMSWLLAFAEMAFVVLVFLYIGLDDGYIGKLTLISVGYISYWAGTGIPFTFVVVVLYGGAFLCILSCLSLLLPIVKYFRCRGMDVFSISGIACIVLYTWNVVDSRVGFLVGYIGKSFKWQYDNFNAYIRYLDLYDDSLTSFTLEHEYLLPILGTLIFNAIVFYVLNRSVKSFDNNLYKVVRDNRHLIEGTVDPMDDYLKEQKRRVDFGHDDIFASLVWTTYGLPMSGWELQQQYTKLGNALDDYDPGKVALYTDNDIQRINNSSTIIHSESRIRSVISNAQVYCKIVNEFGSFYNYFKQLIKDDDQTMFGNLRRGKVSLYAKLLAADLHYRGFKYIGPAKANEFLKNNFRMLI